MSVPASIPANTHEAIRLIASATEQFEQVVQRLFAQGEASPETLNKGIQDALNALVYLTEVRVQMAQASDLDEYMEMTHAVSLTAEEDTTTGSLWS